MDGVDRLRRRKSLQERLGLQGMVCCGPTWAFGPSTMSVRDEDEENDPTHPESEEIQIIDVGQTLLGTTNDQDCLSHSPPSTAVSGMNLAAALAAERNFRAAEQDPEPVDGTNPNTVATAVPEANGNVTSGRMTSAPGTPLRVSLMRLLTESDGLNESTEEKGGGGNDQMCCVCMGRKKGAAFIPCGHTFCRVCSRELWLNRGSCPLCNRSILEILDIY